MTVEAIQTLREAELEAARRLGYDTVPELVEACLPALSRDRSLALMAADGSGIELLYALAVERRTEPGGGIQAIVLAATRSRAARCAAAANAFDADGSARALVWPPLSPPGTEPPADAAVLCGRASEILPEVRAGRVRLANLRLLVIDGIEGIEQAGDWSSVEALLATLEAGAPRIVSCLGPGPQLSSLLTHQLSRAFRWPSELFDDSAESGGGSTPGGAPASPGGSAPLMYAAAAGLEERLDLLATALRDAGKDTVVFCADDPAAAVVARGLAARGLGGGTEGTPSIQVTAEPDGESSDAGVAAVFGLPPDLPALSARLGKADHRLAIVPTRHLGQLLLLARRAGWPAVALPAVTGRPDLEPIERFRALVREELRRIDPAAELLLLEPLLEEHGTVQVAAALASLLRRRSSGPATVKPWPDMEADSGLTVGPLPGPEVERGTRPAWTKIYVGVGRRDGARANDLVGAITGEAGVVGGQIGKIEIRGNFTLVDIDSQVVDDVIGKLDGSTIKGRTVSVRLDREA